MRFFGLCHAKLTHSASFLLAVTNWLIEHGIASVEFVRDETTGALVDAFARIDRKACLERSKEVMGRLLLEIQTRKSTGDRRGAEQFFEKLTKPSDEWVKELRPLVLCTLSPFSPRPFLGIRDCPVP